MRRAPCHPRPLRFLAVALAALAVSGCQQMFTTSLASWATRPNPPVPKTLSQDQATMYAQEVVDNRDTAKAQALLPAMAALVAGNPGDEAALAAAAMTAGVATGIDEALTSIDLGAADPFAGLAAALASIQVTAESTAIFTALADNSVDMATLAAAGATPGTFLVAAAAVILADVSATDLALLFDTDPGNDPFIDPGSASSVLAHDLLSTATSYWPSDPLLSQFGNLVP